MCLFSWSSSQHQLCRVCKQLPASIELQGALPPGPGSSKDASSLLPWPSLAQVVASEAGLGPSSLQELGLSRLHPAQQHHLHADVFQLQPRNMLSPLFVLEDWILVSCPGDQRGSQTGAWLWHLQRRFHNKSLPRRRGKQLLLLRRYDVQDAGKAVTSPAYSCNLVALMCELCVPGHLALQGTNMPNQNSTVSKGLVSMSTV